MKGVGDIQKEQDRLSKLTPEEKERVKGIRIKLSEFLREGTLLSISAYTDKSPNAAPADNWAYRLNTYLSTNLDESYVTRVNDTSDAHDETPSGVTLNTAQKNLWFGIHVRLLKIREIITELSR